MLCFHCVRGSEAFNWKSLATLYLGGGAGNLTVGFWCQMCVFWCFWGEKKRNKNKPNWPNCDPIQLCKYSVKMPNSAAVRFAPKCPYPTDPNRANFLSQVLGFGDQTKNSFKPCQVCSTALSFLLGAQDWEHPSRAGEVQGLHCPPTAPSTARDHHWDRICFNHCCSMAQTFWPGCSCSFYHFWECCDFLYFQFLNYIDYHIKHSWYYRNKLKIISLYLPNTNETHLYY